MHRISLTIQGMDNHLWLVRVYFVLQPLQPVNLT